MPSNYTENYELNQWEKSDKVLMTDFNTDNKKIDAAIKAVEAKADGLAKSKADQSALEAETAVRTAALSSVNTAVSKLGNCRIEYFTVQSVPNTPTTITFSARPVAFLAYGSSALMVCHSGNTGENTSGTMAYYATTSSYVGSRGITWNGAQATSSGCLDPNNRAGTFNIVAFYAEDSK